MLQIFIIFAKREEMEIIAEEDLLELIQTGKNKRYRDVERNPDLMKGLNRALRIMIAVSSTKELSQFSCLHYEQLK